MTWTYSGNPQDSPKDHVRFIIGDTDQQVPLFTDAEIQFLLSDDTSPIHAGIKACDILIAKYSKEVDYSIGPESVKAGQRANNYRRLKRELRNSLGSKSSGPSWDSSVVGGNAFGIGMHDFPGSGRGPGLDG